ncbi:hypothetical protein ACVW0A_002368 [Pseudomonas sp. TE3610]
MFHELLRRRMPLRFTKNEPLDRPTADRPKLAQGNDVEIPIDIHHTRPDDTGIGIDGGEQA